MHTGNVICNSRCERPMPNHGSLLKGKNLPLLRKAYTNDQLISATIKEDTLKREYGDD